MKPCGDNTLIIPDLQSPFHHVDSLPFLLYLQSSFKTKRVVCLGDEIDNHALGDWPKDPDGMSAGHELEAAMEFMSELYAHFPKVFVCTSNHTARSFRRAFNSGIPKAFLKSYSEFLKAPRGWQWADKWEFDGVIYEHGEGLSGKYAALNAAEQNRKSTVIGHVHSHASVQWSASYHDVIFGMNCGCLIDIEQYAFAYGRKIRKKPVLGGGVIYKGMPIFVQMKTDKYNRWIGK